MSNFGGLYWIFLFLNRGLMSSTNPLSCQKTFALDETNHYRVFCFVIYLFNIFFHTPETKNGDFMRSFFKFYFLISNLLNLIYFLGKYTTRFHSKYEIISFCRVSGILYIYRHSTEAVIFEHI